MESCCVVVVESTSSECWHCCGVLLQEEQEEQHVVVTSSFPFVQHVREFSGANINAFANITINAIFSWGHFVCSKMKFLPLQQEDYIIFLYLENIPNSVPPLLVSVEIISPKTQVLVVGTPVLQRREEQQFLNCFFPAIVEQTTTTTKANILSLELNVPQVIRCNMLGAGVFVEQEQPQLIGIILRPSTSTTNFIVVVPKCGLRVNTQKRSLLSTLIPQNTVSTSKLLPQNTVSTSIQKLVAIQTSQVWGTGVVINSQEETNQGSKRYVITNAHVVGNNKNVAIIEQGDPLSVFNAEVVHYPLINHLDIAILCYISPGKTFKSPLSFGVEKQKTKTKAFLLGYSSPPPAPPSAKLVSVVKVISGSRGTSMLLVSPPATQGTSGGLIVDECGKVLGLVVRNVLFQQNEKDERKAILCMCIPVRCLHPYFMCYTKATPEGRKKLGKFEEEEKHDSVANLWNITDSNQQLPEETKNDIWTIWNTLKNTRSKM